MLTRDNYCEFCGRRKILLLNDRVCPVKDCDKNPFDDIDSEVTKPLPETLSDEIDVYIKMCSDSKDAQDEYEAFWLDDSRWVWPR